jgi:hypothetical protein
VPAQRDLSDHQVRDILNRLAAGETGRALAREYRVADMTISNIRNGRTYRQLPRPAGLPSGATTAAAAGLTPAARRLAEATFWASVDRSGADNDCWPWTGTCNNNGYGLTGLRRLPGGTAAFQVAYLLANRLEKLPPGLVVRHLCGNKLCCSPAHLLAGTKQDNYRDGLAIPGGKPVTDPAAPPTGGWSIKTGSLEQLKYQADAERFWSKVQRNRDHGACWPWTGAAGKYGHGNIRWQGTTTSAARVAYELGHGTKPPVDEVVRHTCDRGACCNPRHLLLGTQADNRNDVVQRGHVPHGEAHHYGRRTPDATVRRVRNEHLQGRTLTELALEVGVSINTVADWVAGSTRRAAGGLSA